MGAVDEPAAVGGATVLAARSLTEGTRRRDAIALVEAAERLGASLRAEAGWDATVVGVEVPAERLAPALELLAEVVREPAFPPREVERLRDQRLNDLLQAKADPARRAEEAYLATIYDPASPYARPSGGLRDTRGRHRRRRGRDCLGSWAGFERAALVIGGDLAGIDLPAILEPLLGDLAPAQEAAAPPDPDRRRPARSPGRPGGPSPGLRPVGAARRPPRPAPPHAGLPRRRRDVGDPGRPLQQPAEHEAARGEGLHVRRRRLVRPAPPRGAVHGAGCREHRRDRPGPRGPHRRAAPDAGRRPVRRRAAGRPRLPRRRLPAPLRDAGPGRLGRDRARHLRAGRRRARAVSARDRGRDGRRRAGGGAGPPRPRAARRSSSWATRTRWRPTSRRSGSASWRWSARDPAAARGAA